jgi:Skp family chaperone for outer membrane proteins
VKKSYLWVALAAGLLSTVFSASMAQQPARPAAAPQGNVRPSGIALLDINAIFKEHAGFKARLEQLEQEVKRAESQVKSERDTIKQLSEQLKDLREGSPEFKDLEQRLTERQAAMQVRVRLQQKEFMKQEAKVYHTAYQEIEQEVASVAAAYNIAVVLRYSGDQVDAENPDAILRDINKSVVWSAQSLDLTPIILERLKRRMVPGMTPPAAPGGNINSANRQGVPAFNPNPQR